MKHFGYVYRTVNLVNGKTYVGQRRCHRDKSWNSYLGSGKLIKQAIAKYGASQFRKDLICYCADATSLDAAEAEAIRDEWVQGRGEYNQRAFVPRPDSWTRLPNGRLLEVQELRSKARKTYLSQHESPRHLKAERDYASFKESNDMNLIETTYQELGGALKTAKALGLSTTHVTRYLKEQNLLNPSRAIAGQPMSEAQKRAIANGVLRTVLGDACGVCMKTDSVIRCRKHR